MIAYCLDFKRRGYTGLHFLKTYGFHPDFVKKRDFYVDFVKNCGFYLDFVENYGFYADFVKNLNCGTLENGAGYTGESLAARGGGSGVLRGLRAPKLGV